MKNQINYSQCWEDPAILSEALAITAHDTILSITSGGDNTLALLLKSPQKVVSLDLNNAQNYVLELKIAAIKALSHSELLEFLGARESSRREELFLSVKKCLSDEAASWWGSHLALIRSGVIHAGRFEKFLRSFNSYILPLTHSKKTTSAFLNTSSLSAQIHFYKNIWNSRRWRWFFRILTSRFVLTHFARQPGMFAHTEAGAIAREYQKRVDRHFNAIPLVDNYFMQFCLTGRYGRSLPPYLEEKNHDYLKKKSELLSIVTDDLLSYLKSMPNEYFSKFNLSDIFEALSPEQNNSLWEEIVRTAKNGTRVVYWNNLVHRTFPPDLSAMIKDETELANRLYAKDRVFFYGGFHIHTITK